MVPKVVRDTFLVKVLKFDEKQNEEQEIRNWKSKLESSKKMETRVLAKSAAG